MSVPSILLPVFVQVALTFGLLMWLGRARLASVSHGNTKLGDIALGENNWPPHVQQISNCFNNQFQLPMLFFALVVLALVLRKADLLFVILSWVFVLSRVVHAAIHTTSNNINQRFGVYAVGALALLVMWLIFAIRILFLL